VSSGTRKLDQEFGRTGTPMLLLSTIAAQMLGNGMLCVA